MNLSKFSFCSHSCHDPLSSCVGFASLAYATLLSPKECEFVTPELSMNVLTWCSPQLNQSQIQEDSKTFSVIFQKEIHQFQKTDCVRFLLICSQAEIFQEELEDGLETVILRCEHVCISITQRTSKTPVAGPQPQSF